MAIDVVIPAHNEESRIDATLRSYRRWGRGRDVRLFVALDGCTDGTPDVVHRHAAEDPQVELLAFPKLGKGGVLMESFRRCDADFVGFVDADCATPPAEFERLVEAARHADGAIASRRHPAALLPARRTLRRRLASAGFSFAVRRVFRMPYLDTQCGAKVVHRDVLNQALPFLSSRDFLFDVDLLVVARGLGYRVVEVPTIWIDREGSRLRTGTDAARMAASLLRLWLHHRVLPVEGSRAQAPARALAPRETVDV